MAEHMLDEKLDIDVTGEWAHVLENPDGVIPCASPLLGGSGPEKIRKQVEHTPMHEEMQKNTVVLWNPKTQTRSGISLTLLSNGTP